MSVSGRLVLDSAQWERMLVLIRNRLGQKGSTSRNNWMFVEGVLCIVRTAELWRDRLEALGEWNTVFCRFSRWSRKSV